MKKNILFCMIVLCITANAQTINFKNGIINIEKWNETQLVIPIEIEINNITGTNYANTLSLSFDNAHAATTYSSFTVSDFPNKFEIRNNDQNFSIATGKKITKTFYVVLKKDLTLSANQSIYVKASSGIITAECEINVLMPNDLPYTLTDYLENPLLRLNDITKVESTNNLLTIYGTINNQFEKRTVALKKGQVYAIYEKKYLTNFKNWNFLDAFSIFSVPFKIRPELTTGLIAKDTLFTRTAMSGLTNIGLNLELAKYQMDRYMSNGKKSSHKFSLGFLVAPSVEELDYTYTKGYLNKGDKSKQLFISSAVTVSYTYNDISLVFVPFGWDNATSTIGKEWIYNGKRWWGFGIGISPKIFSSVANK